MERQPSLSAQDPLNLDSLLSEEELSIRHVVRRYVERRVLPTISQQFEEATSDLSLPQGLGELGILGMHLEGYGCPGASAVAYGLACAELEAGDSAIRSFASVQGSLAMFAIYEFGSEEQRLHYLPLMAKGDMIGCFGLTEPDSGSDPSGMRTTARKDGGDWILNGTKQWITNGHIADVSVIWAQTEEGVRGYIVEADNPGLVANSINHKMSLRASATSEISLTDCRVPDSARLQHASGLGAPLSCLNEARFGILWGVTGAARTCYLVALSYSTERYQFGRAIGAFQLTQSKLVAMSLALARSQLLALHLGRLKDVGRLRPEQTSMGKLENCRNAIEIARSSRSILGANGISLEYPIMRHMQNLESVITYEGTEEIHTLAIGRALTGESAFN